MIVHRHNRLSLFISKGLIWLLTGVSIVLYWGEDTIYAQNGERFKDAAIAVLKENILLRADSNLYKIPITITATRCNRSAGGIHDFFSEGDYWWPDPQNPKGPYIRKDGMSNPDNFNKHREALIRFSSIVGNLTSAWLITKKVKYAKATLPHLRAWFITDSTRMNPDLQYAQAIKGRYTGRSIGIIDGIHLMEVAQSVMILEKEQIIPEHDLKQIKNWFVGFTKWLTTSKYGLSESIHPNNHSTCWNMQTAVYARLIGDNQTLQRCRDHFVNHILPGQMATDGSFPLELQRTKPYGYSLFNLDAMVMNVMILSGSSANLWDYTTPDGKTIKQAITWMTPFVEDKSKWPLPHDIMYWDLWPVAQPAFLFGAIRFNNQEWFDIWKNKQHFFQNREVIRNMPVRNPILWFGYL